MKLIFDDQEVIFIRILKDYKKYGERYVLAISFDDIDRLEMSVDNAFMLGLLPKELESNYYDNNASIFEYLSDFRYNFIISKDNDCIKYELDDFEIHIKEDGSKYHNKHTFTNTKDLVNYLEENAQNYNKELNN